ncbi:MAG: sigma-54 dependent transcriptional regulator [Acidobacteria bacterium]|nr:sigma-54 dependent transcriptional regulator [Acidobacteriota bacterium]MCI0718068.1 sigma-54 dependent transcriptional regulator [Acidobacteriota bacterium]
MPNHEGSILVVDDESAIRENLELLLSDANYKVTLAENGAEGLRKLESEYFDLVLLDVMMPDKNGLEVLKEIHLSLPETTIIMITAFGTIENAVSAIKAGAADYVTKPWDNEKLLLDIRNGIQQRKLQLENRELKKALKQRYGFSNIVGKSEKMLKIFDLVAQVAQSRSTVLIQGESGTGKELIAKAIHTNSNRSENAFVTVNSGSLPTDLLESTLFGHLKGAFTSAISSKKGLFEVADRGSIFFDEIGTISLETQAKLLRVLQEREFMRLGGIETIKVDVRIIAATNVDLKTLIEQGRFRDDLYYRLNVISVQLPPLRDRKEDVPLLIGHFIRKFCDENGKPHCQVTPEVLKILVEYDWPGNVRELENVIERAVVLSPHREITTDFIPEHLTAPSSKIKVEEVSILDGQSLFEIVDCFEKKVILQMLESVNWSQTEAAEKFAVPLSTLNSKVKRLGIDIKRKAAR